MLTRTAQLGLKIESVVGSRESLSASDFSGNRKETANSAEITEYERGLERASLSQLENLKGQRKGMAKWTEELVGGGAATSAPWHSTLRACGFKRQQAKAVTIDTIVLAAGGRSPRVGDTVGNHASLGSATKTGTVLKCSDAKFWYLPLTGTFANSDALTFYECGATASATGAPANAGYLFTPVSESDSVTPESATIERIFGGLKYPTVGARGNATISLKLGEPALLTADFTGCPVFGITGAPETSSPILSIPAFSTAPKMAKGISLNFFADSGTTSPYTPIMTALDYNMQTELAPRPTIAGDLVYSGYLDTRITGRKPMVSIDPEMVAPGSFDYTKRVVGGTTFQIFHELGEPTDTNGCLVFWVPKAQLTGNLEFGNRDGIVTGPTQAMLAGSADDELYIAHLF